MIRTLAAVVTVLALTATAHPARATTCPLLTDATGDADTVGYDAGLDIVSADLASDGTDLTGVIRLAALPPNQPPPYRRAYYRLFFAVGGHRLQYVAYRNPDGVALFYAEVADGTVYELIPGYIDGSVDVTSGEIRMTAPLDLLRGYTTTAAGDVVDAIEVTSARELDLVVAGFLQGYDGAATTQTYEVDAPGCITV